MCQNCIDRTERLPQKWHIVAPGARKICPIDLTTKPYIFRTLQEYLFSNDKRWGAWSMLARPAIPARTQYVTQATRLGRNSRSPSKIELLPTELVILILQDAVLEARDIIAFGLTSQITWLHVLRHVQREYLLKTPPLAGMEITCMGSYLSDLPRSFPKDEIDLATAPVSIRYKYQARIYNAYARMTYEKLDQEEPEDKWMAALSAHDTVAAGIPYAAMERMTAELIAMCSALQGHSPDAPWILRNLSTREYIRCIPGSGHKEKRGFVDHPYVKLSIDDALLLRICWTSRFQECSSWKDPKALGICHGRWAGHSFDIVPLENGDLAGWEDVTDSIVRQARIVARNLPDNRGIWAVTKKEKALSRTPLRMTRSMKKKKLEIWKKNRERRARRR